MQEHNFDEILDYLCSGIMSKSEKQNVRDELYDHLMCRYETNLAVGMDEERATQSAINDLGDKTVIKYRLSQVHSYYPKLSMKKAMNLLIIGYVLMTFQINFFTGMGEITKFIGNVIMLVGVYCISKANKRLKQAFYIDLTGFAVEYLSVAVQPLAISDNLYLSTAFSLAGSILNLLFWIFIAVGLNDLVKPYLSEYKKKIPIGFMGFCQFCVAGSVIILHLAAFSSDKLLTDYRDEELFFLTPFIVISAVVTLFVLCRVSKCLWQSDHEYKIEDSLAQKWIAALLAIAFFVVPRVAIDVLLANQKAEVLDFTIEDCKMNDKEYERICGNLLSYGIPENIVYSLPKSEIKNYSRSVNKNELSDEVKNFVHESVSTFSTSVCNDVMIKFSTCAIGMTDESGYPLIRVLSWIDYQSSCDYTYSDAVFWEYHEARNIPLNYDGEYNGNFLLILSDDDGKIVKNEPLDIYSDKNALTDRMTGVRFEGKRELLIIHAEDFGLASSWETRNANYAFEFFHRKTPFSIFYPSPLMLYEASDYFDYFEYRRMHVTSYISWVIPGEEYKQYIATEGI
ncbi:MAG: hypothetical protein IJE74_06540 [Clostridia bacterium]|nr:hypothetical protein [Clostridia bacterium]